MGKVFFSLKTNEPMEFPTDIDILGGYVSVFFWNFHPDRWENDPILTSIFQMGRFNHQLDIVGKIT